MKCVFLCQKRRVLITFQQADNPAFFLAVINRPCCVPAATLLKPRHFTPLRFSNINPACQRARKDKEEVQELTYSACSICWGSESHLKYKPFLMSDKAPVSLPRWQEHPQPCVGSAHWDLSVLVYFQAWRVQQRMKQQIFFLTRQATSMKFQMEKYNLLMICLSFLCVFLQI